LGELFQTVTTPGMQVPDGFAITGDAFMEFLRLNNLEPKLLQILDNLDRLSFGNLARTGETARTLLLQAKLPETLAREAAMAYRALADGDGPVVVRSSALSDDDPAANFAGLHDSFRNVRGEAALLQALKACFASVFNNRAIKYRQEKGFLQEKMSLAIGVQRMVRADLGGSGVAVTLDPETGFRNVVHISAIWGLGENMTHGSATPDEYRVFKPNLARGYDALLRKELGGKEHKLFFDREGTARNTPTPEADRARYVLSDEQAEELARCCVDIEARVGRPMDIEWAIDGSDDILYLLQARPETVQSAQNPHVITVYHLERKGLSLTSGQAIGMKVVSGKARILQSQREPELQPGEIIVTDLVHPDWEPVLELAAAVVTNKGGRTSHASIMARELGIPAVVGCGDATERITDGEWITVSCCEGSTGNVYRGIVPYVLLEHDFSGTRLTAKTRVKLIAGDPDSAFRLSFYPNDGVGLMRLEFLIGHCIRIHPMALVRYEELPDTGLRRLIDERTTGYADKKEYFVDQLAQGIAVMAAAFYPKEVIVRT
ncbi:MAG: phosphoenolpyruvate synthase, partial [Chitinophagaceae bacterium]